MEFVKKKKACNSVACPCLFTER